MRVLFDTNVILDLMLDRAPFADEAEQALSLVEAGEIQGFLGATSITTIYYLATKVLGEQAARAAWRKKNRPPPQRDPRERAVSMLARMTKRTWAVGAGMPGAGVLGVAWACPPVRRRLSGSRRWERVGWAFFVIGSLGFGGSPECAPAGGRLLLYRG